MGTPVYIHTSGNSGLSVSEQKCYLLHEGNNTAIVQCLETYSETFAAAGAVVLLVFLVFIIIFAIWVKYYD